MNALWHHSRPLRHPPRTGSSWDLGVSWMWNDEGEAIIRSLRKLGLPRPAIPSFPRRVVGVRGSIRQCCCGAWSQTEAQRPDTAWYWAALVNRCTYRYQRQIAVINGVQWYPETTRRAHNPKVEVWSRSLRSRVLLPVGETLGWVDGQVTRRVFGALGSNPAPRYERNPWESYISQGLLRVLGWPFPVLVCIWSASVHG